MGSEMCIRDRLLGCRVNILGLKDKRALCYLYMSSRSKKAIISTYSLNNLRITPIGFTCRPLVKSDLIGNCFKIKIILKERIEEENVRNWVRALENGKVPNFYGIQRFGIKNPNHIVGKMLVRREFADAAKMVLGRDFKDERRAIEALRKLPITVRRIYVQAYQSYLFNKMLSVILGDYKELPFDDKVRIFEKNYYIHTKRMGGKNKLLIRIPEAQLAGYSFRPKSDVYSKYLMRILEEEGISYKNFFIRGMEEISVEGGFRPVAIPAWHVNYTLKEDELLVKFVLHTGSYATAALRELVSFYIPEV